MIDFIIGFLCALLSGLGIGGGGLLVIWLVLKYGTEQLTAQGVNLIFFIFSSGMAMLIHLIKRKFNFKLILWLVIFASIGAVVGSLLAHSIDTAAVRFSFGLLLLASGAITFLSK